MYTGSGVATEDGWVRSSGPPLFWASDATVCGTLLEGPFFTFLNRVYGACKLVCVDFLSEVFVGRRHVGEHARPTVVEEGAVDAGNSRFHGESCCRRPERQSIDADGRPDPDVRQYRSPGGGEGDRWGNNLQTGRSSDILVSCTHGSRYQRHTRPFLTTPYFIMPIVTLHKLITSNNHAVIMSSRLRPCMLQ